MPEQQNLFIHEVTAQSDPQDLGTEEESSREDEGEVIPSQTTFKTTRRGRKTKKERREEATDRDKL